MLRGRWWWWWWLVLGVVVWMRLLRRRSSGGRLGGGRPERGEGGLMVVLLLSSSVWELGERTGCRLGASLGERRAVVSFEQLGVRPREGGKSLLLSRAEPLPGTDIMVV